MKTTLRPRRRPSRTETAFEAAVSAFLWAFRILLVLLVVVGSILTLSSGKFSVETWVDLIVNGAVQGGIYALIALGYTMVYGIMKMINFAHGEIFMIGIFAGYFTAEILDQAGFLNANVLTSIISFLLMMLIAAGASTLVALAVERVAYRPLRNSPQAGAAHQRHRCLVLPAVHHARACSARASTAIPPSTSSRKRSRFRCYPCSA